MEDFQQRRVHEQGLWLAYQLGEDLPPQGLHSKRLSFLTRRLNEEGWSPATPGNRCEKNRSESRKKERSLSTPRSCWNKARVTISESERRFMDS